MRYFALGALLGLAGCQAPSQPASDPLATYRAAEARFVYAGKREYPHGTEIYVLDTQYGQVCYFLVSNDNQPDSHSCAGPALAPIGSQP